MRIVNLEEFRKLPAGILFCKYSPCVFGSLQLKGDTLPIDFTCCNLIASVYFEKSSNEMFDTLDRAEKTGESFMLEVDCFGRDGLFEEDELFGIYEPFDIRQLLNVLEESLVITSKDLTI